MTSYLAATGAVLVLAAVVVRFTRGNAMEDGLVDFNSDDECEALGTPVDVDPQKWWCVAHCKCCSAALSTDGFLCPVCESAVSGGRMRKFDQLSTTGFNAQAFILAHKVIDEAKHKRRAAAMN
jgi:hypothetical protein